MISAEPVCDIYMDDITGINTYCSSESGFHICMYHIDKPYPITPVSNNEAPRRIVVLDEAGQPLPIGEKGEVCYDNPFFRGYLNQRAKTKEALRGGVFHSGDRGMYTEDGKLLILGRVDNIYKKDGYIVDPTDIERLFKDITGLKQVIVRGVQQERSLVVKAFYFEEIGLDEKGLRESLAEKLPPYMIPDEFIYVASPPLLPSGKVNVRALMELAT